MLAQLRREGCRAALHGELRRLLDRARDVRLGRIGGQRKMPCTGERVFDQLRQPSVHAGVVNGRCQQRVSEPDLPVLARDHTCLDGRRERLRYDAGALEQRLRRHPDGSSKRERRTRRRRQPGHPPPNQLVQGFRTGNGCV